MTADRDTLKKLRVRCKQLEKKCIEIAQHNADLADTGRRVIAEANRLQAVERDFHEVMGALRRTKMEHGLCEPKERHACTRCMAEEKIEKMLAEYKGPRIVLT